MSQDRRYARGAEDMQEFIARFLETQIRALPEQAVLLQGLAGVVRVFATDGVRHAMERDDAWMRGVAERDMERIRAGWRKHTADYAERRKRKAAGEPVKRGPKPKKP